MQSKEKNSKKRLEEKARFFLHENGAVYIRGDIKKPHGWWRNGTFLGSKALEAKIELERLQAGESHD